MQDAVDWMQDRNNEELMIEQKSKSGKAVEHIDHKHICSCASIDNSVYFVSGY